MTTLRRWLGFEHPRHQHAHPEAMGCPFEDRIDECHRQAIEMRREEETEEQHRRVARIRREVSVLKRESK
jgi:hypothetical protein